MTINQLIEAFGTRVADASLYAFSKDRWLPVHGVSFRCDSDGHRGLLFFVAHLQNRAHDGMDIELSRDRETLESEVADLTAERDALVEEIVALKTQRADSRPKQSANGKARKPRKTLTEKQVDALREKAFDFLASSGPAHEQELVKAVGIPDGHIDSVMQHDWFEQTKHGWTNANT